MKVIVRIKELAFAPIKIVGPRLMTDLYEDMICKIVVIVPIVSIIVPAL